MIIIIIIIISLSLSLSRGVRQSWSSIITHHTSRTPFSACDVAVLLLGWIFSAWEFENHVFNFKIV
jgi:hypothetical protein